MLFSSEGSYACKSRLRVNIKSKMIYKSYSIVPKNDFPDSGILINSEYLKEGFIVTQSGVNAAPNNSWFRTIERAKQWVDENGLPVIVDPQNCSKFMARFWTLKAKTLAGKCEYLDPWRMPMLELRRRFPTGTRIYRASLVAKVGNAEIVTL